ncbi:MAG: CinA family protein [Candidatus Thioglobus sp.]
MFNELVEQIACRLQNKNYQLSCAESCTGGALAAAITSVAGCSGWFERGYVTYSNAAKQDCLGVSASTINKHGAVSEECAREMAAGLLQHSCADYTIAITGVAGPSGGSDDKPVGCVWFAIADKINGQLNIIAQRADFDGSRSFVQNSAVEFALRLLLVHID